MVSGRPPSREDLRRLLAERFPDGPKFDAFCLDNFPEVYREFSPAMDRTTRENHLLAAVDAERVWLALQGRRSSDPSALPPNNLPVRNATFVGRDAPLAELHRALMAEGVASVVPRQVYGLGGVGKTSLALEYAYRHAGHYPGGLWWVRAEGQPEDALVAFAAELKLAASEPIRRLLERLPDNAPSAEVAQALRLSLQNHTLPSLLVLDNVSAEGWRAHIPAGAVRVLVTTRDRSLLRNVAAIHLESFTDAEATQLADRIAGEVHSPLEVAARARVLHAVLGNLAVAVEIAARGVAEWGTSWSRYEALLASQPTRVLEAEDMRGEYPRGAIAALELSIERTGVDTPARRLLEGAAVFAPEAIPREWAVAAAALDDDLSAGQATAKLHALGLLRAGIPPDSLDLHRLVRLTARELAAHAENGESWKATRRRALFCTRDWLQSTVEIGRIAVVEARRPHIEELVETTQSLDERAWSEVINHLATHLWHRAEHATAQSLFERALLANECSLGTDHPDIASLLSNLALVLRDLGDAAAAKPLLERALRIDEATFSPDHPNVAISLSNLGMVLQDLGDAAAAKPLFERALRIDETMVGPNHPHVAIRFSNLATALRDLGNSASAKPLLERALCIDESTFGTDHPNVATRLSNLGMVLQDLGDATAAKPLLERALRINEATLGTDHPVVATTLANLAMLLNDLGDSAAAKALFERALSIGEANFGPDHPNVATCLSNLATVFHDLGDAASAKPLFERALRIHETTLGPDHPSVATILSNLAIAFQDLGDAPASRPLLERALRIHETTLGPDHPSVATILSNLAMVLKDLGDAASAKPLLERAAAIFDARLGPDHPKTKIVRANLAALQSTTEEP